MPQTREVRLDWSGDGLRFAGQGVDPPSPAVTIDGSGEHGPSPTQALLLSCAACSGAETTLFI